uniref:Uncharacterized protein n=1 Tax=Gouania willdenowi TaxID=441366 RepID=A0A8C5EFR7_GOUWI
QIIKHNFLNLTWNVNVLNNPVKRNRDEHEKLKKSGYKNTFYSTHKGGHKRGVAILIHNSIHFELIREIRDNEGRYIPLITTESQGILICAGDFNTIINNKWDLIITETKTLRRDMQPYTVYFLLSSPWSLLKVVLCFRMKDIELQNVRYELGIFLTIHQLIWFCRPKKTIWRLNTSLFNNRTLISLSSAIKRAKENKLTELENNLKDLETKHSKKQDPQVMIKMKETKNQILDIHKKIEVPKTKYFFIGRV